MSYTGIQITGTNELLRTYGVPKIGNKSERKYFLNGDKFYDPSHGFYYYNNHKLSKFYLIRRQAND